MCFALRFESLIEFGTAVQAFENVQNPRQTYCLKISLSLKMQRKREISNTGPQWWNAGELMTFRYSTQVNLMVVYLLLEIIFDATSISLSPRKFVPDSPKLLKASISVAVVSTSEVKFFQIFKSLHSSPKFNE